MHVNTKVYFVKFVMYFHQCHLMYVIKVIYWVLCQSNKQM